MVKKYSKLKPLALGWTLGILCGVGLWLTTIISTLTGIWQSQLSAIIGLYPGYAVTLTGSFFGLIFGFIDGFIGGLLIAGLYNLFLK
jgi:hypothetical protein